MNNERKYDTEITLKKRYFLNKQPHLWSYLRKILIIFEKPEASLLSKRLGLAAPLGVNKVITIIAIISVTLCRAA
jgi:hypothetical protein